MMYTVKDVHILIQRGILDKKLGLYVGTDDPNKFVKVASFTSDDKANLFMKWFEYMAGYAGRDTVKWE